MTEIEAPSVRRLVKRNLGFFGITALFAIIGLPLYAYHVGLKTQDWVLFVFMSISTMMATTFGYHRLFAHKAFKAHPIIEFLNLFFGAAAFEGSVVDWASQHRNHHRYTDTDKDPYNIKEGFWYAHMGWFLFRRHRRSYENVKDLLGNPIIKNQHDFWIVWAILGGVLDFRY